ncbi:MAG TPA: hypothetical protein VII92_00830 [Anaerolineae bacterium]
MKTKRTLTIVALTLMLAAPVAAQTQTPPPPVARTAIVSGKIVNRTEGGSVPAQLDLVLHAWDQQVFSEKLMLDGKSNPDGTFRFEDVPITDGLLYGVMANYNGVSYFSQPVPAGDQPLTDLEVPIYETTTDGSKVQIAQAHVLFLSSHAGLEVAEVYSLSNSGTRTVQGALKLADGKAATIQFPLPPDATNVTFPDNRDRFVRTPDGFADTAPVVPGENAGQIIVNYILPYQSGMTFSYTAQLPTGGLSFLIDDSSGLTASGDGLSDAGAQSMGDGSKFAMLKHAALQPGEKVAITLSGELQLKAPPTQPQAESQSSLAASPITAGVPNVPIVIGGIVIGLTLIVLGLWWFRRPDPALASTEAPDESTYKDLLTQIALLDDAHDRGEMDEATYKARRTELFQQARLLMQASETQ